MPKHLSTNRLSTTVCALTCSFILFTISPGTSAFADHLLISEICVTPDTAEFVEIVNPTDAPIALDNYYLCDDQDYFYTPGYFGGAPDPDVSGADFIVRFPPGAVIDAHSTIVVAMHGISFFNTFGFRADFEIRNGDALTPDTIHVTSALGAMFSGGEMLALYYWDNASDLVKDVDLVRWGTPSGPNNLLGKTGVSVDGPDPGSTSSTYLPDAMTIPTPGVFALEMQSFKRIAFEDDNEISTGGNGITGHDETSENTAITWNLTAPGAPNPGLANLAHPAPPAILLNEIHYDPDAALGDANGDGAVNAADQFIEVINDTGGPFDLTGFRLCDSSAIRHVFPNGTVLEECQAVIVFAGGTPKGDFGSAIVQTASTGQLALDVTGDTARLFTAGGFLVAGVPCDHGAIGQSIVRNPDITGETFVPHMTASAAAGRGKLRYSPGTRIDLSPFDPCHEEPSCLGDLVTSATFQPPPDGLIDGADLAFLLGDWGANPGSAADLVTSATFKPPPDGVVDGADLAVLLGAWGACE